MNISSVVQRTVVTTERLHQIIIDDTEIRELLRRAGYQIPAKAQIFFTVPGGGDWSNSSVDITREFPVTIEWTEIFEQEQPAHDRQKNR